MKLDEFVKLTDNISSWNFSKISNGIYDLKRQLSVKKEVVGYDFTGPYWIFGKFELSRPNAWFRHNQEFLKVKNKQFTIWLPPYSMIEVTYKNVEVKADIILGRNLNDKINQESPCLFYPSSDNLSRGIDDISRILQKNISNLYNISISNNTSILTDKCKKTIDKSFIHNIPISDVAKRCKTSHSQMTRSFKKDYGITPIFYRNWMRVMSASFLLLEQTKIADTQGLVGFEDLSRFNKQFKKITHSTPKQFKAKKKSKNA